MMATRQIKTQLTLSGEKQWRSEMQSVNSQLKTLRSELNLSSSEFRGQANTMAALTSKQQILQKQYDQQKEKVRALADALEQASKIYTDSPEKIDMYQRQLNAATVQLHKMGDELGANTKLVYEASKSHDGCAHSIDTFGKEVEEAGEKSLSFGDIVRANLTSEAVIAGVKALAAAFKGVSTAIKDTVVESAAYADDILTMSTVTGISTDALQEYKYMAELTDVSVDTITSSLSKMTRNMGTAQRSGGAAAEAFDVLGVSIMDSDGKLRNNQEVFAEALGALGNIENQTQRDAYAMAIFGRSAQDLNPLIAQGAEGIAGFAQEARDMGYVLDEDALNALGAVDDAMQRFDKALEGAKNNLSVEFAPAVTAIFDGLTLMLSGDIDAGVAKMDEGIDLLGVALEKLGPYAEQALLLLIKTIIDQLPNLINAGSDVLMAIINGIVTAMPELVPTTVDMVLTVVSTLLDNIDLLIDAAIQLAVGIAVGLVRAIPSIVSKLPNIIAAIVDGLLNGVTDLAGVGEDLIRGLWNGISNMGAWIGQKIRGFGQGIVDQLKDFFGIHSPASKHMPFIGEMSAQGVGVGFEDAAEDVTDNMARTLGKDIDRSMSKIPTSYELAANVRMFTDPIVANNFATTATAMRTDYMREHPELRQMAEDLRWIRQNGSVIVLDDGTIVGRWAPMMDRELGKLAKDKERGT